ncbi:MAG: InlB B-repeat-containing protein [Eubacteriales bacterium]
MTYELNGGVNDDSNPATYTIESADITLANPTKAGYNFLGWTPTDNIPNGSTGDKSFTATWSDAIVYDISYELNGGANNGSNPTTYTVESALITLANPTKAGYNFLGWTPTDNIPAGSTGDKSFTATWSNAIVYDISYELNGGDNDASNPSTYTVESGLITLANPTKAGFNFIGWTPTDNIPAGSTGDKAFTAVWSDPIAYNITYVMNNGTNDPSNPATYNVTSATITLAAPTRLGYNFLGWSPSDTIATGSTGDKTFTARWSTAIRYNITYTMNGGNNSIFNPSRYTVNSATITLRDPWRIGYDFAGWTPTDNIPTGSTGDKAFTATWTPSVYTIHYYLNGGTNDAANPATYTTETPTINLANPTRAGYDCWFWLPLDTIPRVPSAIVTSGQFGKPRPTTRSPTISTAAPTTR